MVMAALVVVLATLVLLGVPTGWLLRLFLWPLRFLPGGRRRAAAG
jgi:hypothetical protein